MEFLHTYSDGSKLYKMSASLLTRIPIWKGNRIIDYDHVKNIKESAKANLLDSGYKIIRYNEMDDEKPINKSFIIDGQHRISVVKDYLESKTIEDEYFEHPKKDFQITVTEICVDSEADAIEYFKKINNVKSIQFQEDPNLIMNEYILKLDESFPKKFRDITKRPYVSLDKFREALKLRIHSLKKVPVDNFVKECKLMNTKIIEDLKIKSLNNKDKELKIMNRMIQINFALAWDDKFKWLDTILH